MKRVRSELNRGPFAEIQDCVTENVAVLRRCKCVDFCIMTLETKHWDPRHLFSPDSFLVQRLSPVAFACVYETKFARRGCPIERAVPQSICFLLYIVKRPP